MKQKYIGVRMIRVRGEKLPNNILEGICGSIRTILERHQCQTKKPQKKEIVLLKTESGQLAVIATKFKYDPKKHGFLFHVFLYLRNVVRRVAGYCANIAFETMKASFAVESTIGSLSYN